MFDHAVVGPRDTKYATSHGSPELRKGVASFLGSSFGVSINPEHVFGVAGVSATLECLAFVLLGEPAGKTTVLTPAPCWQGFDWCFAQRPKGTLQKFPTAAPQIVWSDVENALKAHTGTRLLVLTNPHNPLGINYDPRNLELIYQNVLRSHPDVHIISDEIYGLSQVGEPRPRFVSAFKLEAYRNATAEQQARVHVVWGVAKDFGLSGFKGAFILSTSQQVFNHLRPWREGNQLPRQGMAWFAPMDSLKHIMLTRLFTGQHNGRVIASFASEEYRKELKASHEAVVAELNKHSASIPYLKDSNAAQFFWLDLSRHLNRHFPLTASASDSRLLFPEIDEREARLHQYLQDTAKVQLLPGQTLANPAPGWFRLCYTAEKSATVVTAIQQIAAALR